MKKVVSLKSLMVVMLSCSIIGITTSIFATDSVLETDTGNNVPAATEVTAADLNTATTIPTDNNTIVSSTESTTSGAEQQLTTSTGEDTNSAYKTVDEDNSDKMPQTGIEDHYVGILLIICVAAAIFTYKKMKDYKNV